ncbi:NUDIX domain-containing protein [Chitinophaga sp. GbtcB8]|uniref:NUDIX hydrolase n=1 Tax=Chitinophaga sp. GbtcB8 TaxID=2824753 RepID=UPI0020C6A06D|nr:NUDIX domain-containing protein [Chitinophaga sp. GbtcB8]
MGNQNEGGAKGLKEGIREFMETAPAIYMPGLSVDTVIFGFHNDKLKVFLLRFANTPYFILPGGFIKKEENLDDAALRILQERTGLQDIYLEQFYTSGNTSRSKETVAKEELQKIIGKAQWSNWFDQRFVSVCYYALIDDTKVKPETEIFFTEFKWFDVNKLPKLMYDHDLIIKKALSRLQSDLDEKLVGFNLMSETFTMGQLQKLYEAVHQKKFVRTNFQRKLLSLNVLERLEKQYTGKAHKAPFLYRFVTGENE